MRARGELAVSKTVEGHKLKARWWYWESKLSKNPIDPIRYAQDMYACARDMLNRPEYYARKPDNKTCWEWFCLSANTGSHRPSEPEANDGSVG